MVELARDFDEFFGSLIAHGVEFLVVGGYALAFHGAPRFTGDIDVFVRPTLSNAGRLIAALEAFGFPTGDLEASRLNRAVTPPPDGRRAGSDPRHGGHQRGRLGGGVGRP